MRVPRPTSLSFVNCMLTMRLPSTRPRRIITAVDSMLSISFCAVPAFMRVDPVTNSGPTTASSAYSASAATGDDGLQVMEAVNRPCSRAMRRPPTT